jgi:hypothetical protein
MHHQKKAKTIVQLIDSAYILILFLSDYNAPLEA